MSPIITVEQLKELQKQTQLVLIDARTGKQAKENYTANHLDGALFVDLDKDLAAIKPNPADGGRHPLPGVSDFAALLGKLGISTASTVVVYDDKTGGGGAARFWWMMRAVGHGNIHVLSGGYDAAVKYGYPVNDHVVSIKETEPYPVIKWLLPTIDIHEAGFAALDDDKIVIDVRSAERYRGETEPIDLVAGHIPGAINVPFSGNMNSDGEFLPAAELHKKYAGIIQDKPISGIIVHCGSGVTACNTLLAITEAGFDTPVLYVGSWSEWSRNDKPIAKGEA